MRNRQIEPLLSRLRFRHLQFVETVSRTGSMRAAASELHLTQPALSKSLKELETILDARLFERTRRGLVPTAEGLVLIRGIALLMEDLAHTAAEIDAAAGRQAFVVLRLGTLAFLAQSFVPHLCARLLRRPIPMLVRLREGRVTSLLDELASGELDALITTYTVDTQTTEGAEQLRYEILFEEKFVVIAPAEHALVKPKQVPWSRIAGERWILPERSAFIRRLVDEAFLREHLSPPSLVVQSNRSMTNLKLVAAGVGLSAVPSTMVSDAGSTAGVRKLRIVPPLASTRVALVYRRAGANNPRISMLREALDVSLPNG